MFEIWQLDRNGNPHKLLTSTPFSDMAEITARAIAERLWSLDGHPFVEEGKCMIQAFSVDEETGSKENFCRIVARPSNRLQWRIEND